jgi:hypothetical protein
MAQSERLWMADLCYNLISQFPTQNQNWKCNTKVTALATLKRRIVKTPYRDWNPGWFSKPRISGTKHINFGISYNPISQFSTQLWFLGTSRNGNQYRG